MSDLLRALRLAGQRGGSQIVPANYDAYGRQFSLSLDYKF